MAHNLPNKKISFSILILSTLIECGNFSHISDAFAQDNSSNQKMKFNIPSTFLKMPKSMVEKQRRADELQTKTYDELQFESVRETMYQQSPSKQNQQMQTVKTDAEFTEIVTESGNKKVYKFDIDESQSKTTTIYKDEVVVLKAPVRKSIAPTTIGAYQGYYSPAQKGTYTMPGVRSGGQVITTTPTTTIRTEITETEYVKSPKISSMTYQKFPTRAFEKPVWKMEKLNAFGAVALHNSGSNWDLQASPPKGTTIYVKSDKVHISPVAYKRQAVDKDDQPIKNLNQRNLPNDNKTPVAIVPEKPFIVKEQKEALKAKNDLGKKTERKNEDKVDNKSYKTLLDKSVSEKKLQNTADKPLKKVDENKKNTIVRNEVFKSLVYAPNRQVSADEYQSTMMPENVELGLDTVRTKAQKTKSETEEVILKVGDELRVAPTDVNNQ